MVVRVGVRVGVRGRLMPLTSRLAALSSPLALSSALVASSLSVRALWAAALLRDAASSRAELSSAWASASEPERIDAASASPGLG